MSRKAFIFTLIVAVYVSGGQIGLILSPISDYASLVWHPAGTSLGFLILFGTNFWPAVFVASLIFNLLIDPDVLTATLLAAGSALSIFIGAQIFCKLDRQPEKYISSIRSALLFVVVAALPASLMAAAFGGLVLALTNSANFFQVFTAWSFGDFLSHLIAAPLIVKFAIRFRRREFHVNKILELVVLLGITIVINYFIFWTNPPAAKYGLTFLLFPSLVWAAARFGLFGTSLLTLVQSFIAVWATVRGFGPFFVGETFDNLFFLEVFVAVFVLMGFVISTAITERSNIRDNLKENYNFLSSLTDGVADAIFVKDVIGKYLFINPYGAKVMGGTVADVIGKTDADFFPPHVSSSLIAWDQKVITTKEPVSVEETVIVDGKEAIFLAKKFPYFNARKEIVGVLGIARDITENKLLERERIESENRFHSLADQAPVLIWSATADKACDWFNKPWLAFTGRTMDQELGNGWTEGVHPDDFARCLRTYHESFDKRQKFSMDYRLRRYDGEYRWVVDTGTPRFSASGEFVGYLGTCIDIHERRELENSLKEALHSRDEFLSIASHELKTPLTSLSLQAQLLIKGTTAPLLKEKLDTAFRQIDKLNTLIEDLLDVSRIRAGRLRFRLEDFEVGHAIQDVVDLFIHHARNEGYNLEVELPPPTIVHWDRQRFDQVLGNLISNAIKYGNKKPVKIRATVDDKTVCLTVADSGIGISDDDQKRIFERFERAVSSRHFGGLGMGLYIVKQIVVAHGGDVRVESRVDQGSTFQVQMPIRAVLNDGNVTL